MFLTFLLQAPVPSVSTVDSLVSNLSQQGPLVSIFILIALYLGYQLHMRDKEISKLNDYIRESDKENVIVLTEVNNTLDRVLENQKNTNEVVIKEISSLKEFLIHKFGHN